MTKKNDISLRLKQLRKQRELRQEDVAEILGIVRATYAAKEAGRNQFIVTELAVLADYYDVSVEWILSGNNDKKKDYLTEQEARLVNAFRNLSDTEKNALMMAAMDFILAKSSNLDVCI